MKVLIISGGNSSERRISLISAKTVKQALEKSNFQVQIFDLKKGLKILEETTKDYDIIFPVLHGEEGEGGHLQKFLDRIGKPYVGGHYKGYQEGWYKISFKKFCDKNKIHTAPWKIIKHEIDIIKFGLPCVIKGSSGGSSIEVFIIEKLADLKRRSLQKFLKSGVPFMIEKYISGIEVTVGILGHQALPVIEIIPKKGRWFDYKSKYSGEAREIIDAPSLSEEIRQKVQQIALQIHQKLNLGPYSRIDFIISNNIPYALEVNTIPGWTSESLFPKAAKAVGISFEQLVEKLIEISLKR